MHRQSAFVCETSHARLHGEAHYCFAFSVTRFLCGALFFFIPFDRYGLFILIEGWLLLAALGFCLLRPLFYGRGVADFVMSLFIMALYGLLGFSLGSTAYSIENYGMAISFALFFAGLSRIVAFARMIVVVNLPLLLVCGLFEMTAAVLLFIGWPGDDAAVICWFSGTALVLSGFESLAESAKLRAQY
jgi:hypothetical protein